VEEIHIKAGELEEGMQIEIIKGIVAYFRYRDYKNSDNRDRIH